MKISIVGTGYVGLVTGVCMADKGHDVTCVDVDAQKIATLNGGKAPIYESGLEELMLRNKERLTYTTDGVSAFKNADVIFIGVGTPEKKDGSANLTYVYEAAKQIAMSAEHSCVVVVKSTVPVGTNEKVEKLLNDNKRGGVEFHVVSNPEFLAQGSAVRDTLSPSRIVIGANDLYSENVMRRVYAAFDAPLLVMKRSSAEMVKYASNDFLALKISYMNEIANLCEIVGADVDDVAKGMGYDDRIGNKFLNAGIGYGGSCFPKDTKALHWLASMNDYEIKTIKAAIEVNELQKLRLIKKAREFYSGFEGLTVAVLGLTFKPGTDDLREAPSLVNIPLFIDDGARVKVWDPMGYDKVKKLFPSEIEYCATIDETITDADACFIFTEWSEIVNYDVKNYQRLMRKPIILDGRNCYNPAAFNGVNAKYVSVGRAK